jgi:hypothetical protein
LLIDAMIVKQRVESAVLPIGRERIVAAGG